MLIWCSKCGTSFDVEKRGSICPGCGYDTSGGVEKKQKEKKEKRRATWKFTKGQIIGCSILFGLMLIVGIEGIIKKNTIVNQNEIARNVGVVSQQTISSDEKLSVNGGKLRIIETKLVDTWQENLPEGYAMLWVKYSLEESYESTIKYDTNVYMQFETGEYVEALQGDSVIKQITGVSEYEAECKYAMTSGFTKDIGHLAFLVPNSLTKADLVIYSMTGDGDRKDADYVQILDSVYRMQIEWEVQ